MRRGLYWNHDCVRVLSRCGVMVASAKLCRLFTTVDFEKIYRSRSTAVNNPFRQIWSRVRGICRPPLLAQLMAQPIAQPIAQPMALPSTSRGSDDAIWNGVGNKRTLDASMTAEDLGVDAIRVPKGLTRRIGGAELIRERGKTR